MTVRQPPFKTDVQVKVVSEHRGRAADAAAPVRGDPSEPYGAGEAGPAASIVPFDWRPGASHEEGSSYARAVASALTGQFDVRRETFDVRRSKTNLRASPQVA